MQQKRRTILTNALLRKALLGLEALDLGNSDCLALRFNPLIESGRTVHAAVRYCLSEGLELKPSAMSANGLSTLSFVAAGFYALVVIACLAAAFVALAKKQQLGRIYIWAGLAALFAVLIFLRLNDLEEIWRDQLRDMMRAEGAYEARRAYQLPLALGVITLIELAVFAWIVRSFRTAQGRRNVAVAVAQLGAFLMAGLIALRMVSLSLVDRMLYGPMKLNWVVDIGSATLVAGCAAYYVVVVLAPPRRKKPL